MTTRRDQNARPAPDLVDRNFTASGPDQLWVMASHLRSELVLDAMEAAVGQRRPKDVIHHSDQGSQYTSVAFGKRAALDGIGE